MYKKLIEDVKKMGSPEKIELNKRYFKVGPGTYSEGDIFVGGTTAEEKEITNKYKKDLTLEELEKLLNHEIHEVRRVALNILRYRYEKARSILRLSPRMILEEQRKIYELSMKNKHGINNWDLVDIYAPHVFSEYLYDKDRKILYDLVVSDNLWDRRIAIMSTHYFITQNDFKDTLKLAEILLNDKEDLIHKASGWMLREVGKRDINELYKFLDKYHKVMPRTMLRYSIEKLSPEKRKHYMAK